MVAFIEAGAPIGAERPVPDARLLAPLVPRSFRDFLAFEGHLKNAYKNLGRDVPAEWYEVPVYYRSMGTTVIGPDTVLPWPSYTRQLDHELELAAVIGRPCRDVAPDDALDCVFGFTIWNDMSARDVQRRELPVGMGPAKAKEWDGSSVLGPCLVTRDEIDLATLELEVRVNGERWGGDRVSAMHYGFGDLIAYAAQDQTLLPGEVLGSGTATGGSGLELDRWIQPGDVIEMEAGPIGILRNTVRTPNRKDHRHGVRRRCHLEGQARGGHAGHRGDQEDDAAVPRGAGERLLPGAGQPRGPRDLLPLRAVRRRAGLRGPQEHAALPGERVRLHPRVPGRAQRQDLRNHRCLRSPRSTRPPGRCWPPTRGRTSTASARCSPRCTRRSRRGPRGRSRSGPSRPARSLGGCASRRPPSRPR